MKKINATAATETVENYINGNLSDFRLQVLKASKPQLIYMIKLALVAYDLQEMFDAILRIYEETEGY